MYGCLTDCEHLTNFSLFRRTWIALTVSLPTALIGYLFLCLSLATFALTLQKRVTATSDAPHRTTGIALARNLSAARYQTPHQLVSSFITLVNEDGAGTWPPRANHSSWPLALRPYKHVYLEMVQYLSVETPSLNDNVNRERCNSFRSLMQKLLTERINNSHVKEIMQQMESGNLDILPHDQINGFYCVVAVCRHAYRYTYIQPISRQIVNINRWATIPVVKVSQAEKIIEFPPELEIPWPFLQCHFGITAESGNNTANVLLNFDENGERVYKINVGSKSDLIRTSEEVFFRMFRDIEVMVSATSRLLLAGF